MNTWILVIDDDPGIREALAEILGRVGYCVSTWADDALLDTPDFGQKFQVAIVDYHLPSGDGLAVAVRLKSLQPDCRIILTSSELPPTSELSVTKGLVDRFLSKPFSKDVILEVVAQLCHPETL